MHSVKEMKLEKKKIKEQEQVIATEGGGALTSDLFNKLGLRRKYISEKGPADRNADSPAGAFAQISDTIRPMPPPQVMSGDGNVDEWESWKQFVNFSRTSHWWFDPALRMDLRS